MFVTCLFASTSRGPKGGLCLALSLSFSRRTSFKIGRRNNLLAVLTNTWLDHLVLGKFPRFFPEANCFEKLSSLWEGRCLQLECLHEFSSTCWVCLMYECILSTIQNSLITNWQRFQRLSVEGCCSKSPLSGKASSGLPTRKWPGVRTSSPSSSVLSNGRAVAKGAAGAALAAPPFFQL